MRDFIGTFLIMFGMVLMVGVVGRADFAVATRSYFSDLRLLIGMLIGIAIMVLGAWVKGWIDWF